MTLFHNLNNFSKAALYSVLAYFIMALGIVAWKSVLASYSISQILALEALVSLPLFVGLAKIRGGVALLKTSYPLLQMLRGLLQTCAAYVGLYGLLHLPVSTYTMLQYCTPFIVTLAAWLALKEKCPPVQWLCILGGFAGAALIIQPEYTTNLIAALAIILSSCFWAANIILMKKMPKDHVVSFPFYTVLFVGFISCIIVTVQGIVPMSKLDFGLVTIAGIFFFTGAQILFVTYRLTPLYFLTPFQYTQIGWIIALSYLLWAEVPTGIQIAGLAVIILMSICSSYFNRKASSP